MERVVATKLQLYAAIAASSQFTILTQFLGWELQLVSTAISLI